MIARLRSLAFMVCDNSARNLQFAMRKIARSRFDEEEGLFWDSVVEFLDVVYVVSAYGYDLRIVLDVDYISWGVGRAFLPVLRKDEAIR
jgi:hypothetical protein